MLAERDCQSTRLETLVLMEVYIMACCRQVNKTKSFVALFIQFLQLCCCVKLHFVSIEDTGNVSSQERFLFHGKIQLQYEKARRT